MAAPGHVAAARAGERDALALADSLARGVGGAVRESDGERDALRRWRLSPTLLTRSLTVTMLV